MTSQDYYEAKAVFSERKLLAQKELSNEPAGSNRAFTSYIETLITIKGHAWAMDVKSERKKMARLITKGLLDLHVLN